MKTKAIQSFSTGHASGFRNRINRCALFLLTAFIMTPAFSGCASGSLKVITSPARPLSSYRTLALVVNKYDTLIPEVGAAEVNKLKNAIFLALGKSGRFDGIFEFPVDAKKAQLWMQVKPTRLNTGLNYNSLVFGPRVILEITVFDARSRKVLTKFEATGENTDVIGFGGVMGLIQAGASTSSAITNASEYVSTYFKEN